MIAGLKPEGMIRLETLTMTPARISTSIAWFLRGTALAQIEKLQMTTAKEIAAGYVSETGAASFKLIVNPLVTWMWIGGLIALN